MDADRRRWDERYAARPTARPARPIALADRPALVERVPTRGRALDLAAGLGEVTLWLAERGLDVVALDVSPVAVGRIAEAADELAVAERVRAAVADLDAGVPAGVGGGFDVVVCQRFRDPALYGPIVDALRDGGLAIVTVLSEVGLDGTPGDFHAAAGELRAAFTRPDVEVLLDVEADGLASIAAVRHLASSPSSGV